MWQEVNRAAGAVSSGSRRVRVRHTDEVRTGWTTDSSQSPSSALLATCQMALTNHVMPQPQFPCPLKCSLNLWFPNVGLKLQARLPSNQEDVYSTGGVGVLPRRCGEAFLSKKEEMCAMWITAVAFQECYLEGKVRNEQS